MLALLKKRAMAIRMRKQGASYNQIKAQVDVSKSSLSLWLRDMPLPEKRLRELRDFNATRIERYRETRRRTREARWDAVRKRSASDIGSLTEREFFIAGLFLYWGEGGKTKLATTSISNNDPAMILFFMRWLKLLGVPKTRLRVYMHFYTDMNARAELCYWSRVLNLPLSSFRKPYIKKSNRSGLTYKQKFSHGTCNLIYDNRDISEYVLMAIEHLRSVFAERKQV